MTKAASYALLNVNLPTVQIRLPWMRQGGLAGNYDTTLRDGAQAEDSVFPPRIRFGRSTADELVSNLSKAGGRGPIPKTLNSFG